MAKLLMIVADNFEDVEAIATLDVLKRGGHIVNLASVIGRKDVITKCGYTLQTNSLIEEVNISEYDGLIIPGGPGSFQILNKIPVVDELIKKFFSSYKLVAAICAAPHLLGKAGVLREKNYTCYPGFENDFYCGKYHRNSGVIKDGNVITAKSMYYSIDFGIAIHEYFKGEESGRKLRISLQGEEE